MMNSLKSQKKLANCSGLKEVRHIVVCSGAETETFVFTRIIDVMVDQISGCSKV
jgi:hypothetical protein